MKPFSSTFLQQDIYISHSSQSASDSILLSLQANITSISNMTSINDSEYDSKYFLKCCWLQTLHTLNTMRLLKNIPNIKEIQFIISSAQNSGLECLLKVVCFMQNFSD